ncbi:MAG: Transposase [Microgenomates group bacterium Gr01-1014_5]|nr:MAG: Transposase [Microgenomates group bacterium Gr01-1014_5]
MYFNRKYKRVGALFQAVYKAVIVETDIQLLYLTKYLHRQALRKPRYFSAKKSASKGEALRSWKVVQPCSYPEYLGQRKTEWVKPDEVLYFFSRENPLLSYRAFIEEFEDLSMIQNITLE